MKTYTVFVTLRNPAKQGYERLSLVSNVEPKIYFEHDSPVTILVVDIPGHKSYFLIDTVAGYELKLNDE